MKTLFTLSVCALLGLSTAAFACHCDPINDSFGCHVRLVADEAAQSDADKKADAAAQSENQTDDSADQQGNEDSDADYE